MTKKAQTHLNAVRSTTIKQKRNRLAEMSAIERLISGCRNPRPIAKPNTRYAVMLALSRRS